MKPELFQEIKDIVGDDIGGMINKRFARDLIAAVEEAQAEVAEANKWKDIWESRCRYAIEYLRERKKEVAALRKQLAEAQQQQGG